MWDIIPFYSVDYLHDTVRRRYLPVTAELYSLLGVGNEDEDGLLNFADLIVEALNKFEEYNPLALEVNLDNISGAADNYQFNDNFNQYLDKLIPPERVQLIPKNVVNLVSNSSSTLFRTRANSKYWSYNPDTGLLKTSSINGLAYCFFRYKYKLKVTDDKTAFTADSGVYFIGDKNIDQFIHILAYFVIKRIKNYSSLISLPSYMVNINFDDIVSELKDAVDLDRMRSAKNYIKWKY